jgi:hypothetical protein
MVSFGSSLMEVSCVLSFPLELSQLQLTIEADAASRMLVFSSPCS